MVKQKAESVVLNGCVLGWFYVISGVPQWSIFGPVLFLTFINGIDKGVVNKLLIFADDTKFIGVVSNEIEMEKLRSDLQNYITGQLIGK